MKEDILGKAIPSRQIIYRNGDYFFADTNERVPDKFREGFRITIFKSKSSTKTGPYDMTGLIELKKEVDEKLRKGEMKKENKHILC